MPGEWYGLKCQTFIIDSAANILEVIIQYCWSLSLIKKAVVLPSLPFVYHEGKVAGDLQCSMPLWLNNPCGLSTLYRCLLTITVTKVISHRISHHTETARNHLRVRYLNQPAVIPSQPGSAPRHTGFYETISNEFLVQGNYKQTLFSGEYCTVKNSQSGHHRYGPHWWRRLLWPILGYDMN